jgi:hypothetical protein
MVVGHPAVASHSQPPVGQRRPPATLHSLVEPFFLPIVSTAVWSPEKDAPRLPRNSKTTRRRVLLVRPGYDPSLDGDGKEGFVDKSYYDADSIEPVLRWFENR